MWEQLRLNENGICNMAIWAIKSPKFLCQRGFCSLWILTTMFVHKQVISCWLYIMNIDTSNIDTCNRVVEVLAGSCAAFRHFGNERTNPTQHKWHTQYGNMSNQTRKVCGSPWVLLTLNINNSVCTEASSLAGFAASTLFCYTYVIVQSGSWGINWELFRLQYRHFGNEGTTLTRYKSVAYATMDNVLRLRQRGSITQTFLVVPCSSSYPCFTVSVYSSAPPPQVALPQSVKYIK